MNPYDTAAVQRVWQRVHSSVQQSGGSNAALLTALWTQACASAQGYRHLAARAGRQAGCLRLLAAQQEESARTLSALSVLLYGTVPPRRAAHNRWSSLREAYQAELQSAARYAEAAERWPDQGMLFLNLKEQAQRRALRLLSLTAQRR